MEGPIPLSPAMRARFFSSVALGVCLCLGPRVVSAQDPAAEAARQGAEQERLQQEAMQRAAALEMERQRERSIQAMNEFLKDSRTEVERLNDVAQRQREAKIKRERAEFIAPFQAFRLATGELHEAIARKGKLKTPADKIEDTTKVFLNFLKDQSKDRPRFNSSEFEDFKDSELAWEALATAERITPKLDAVVAQEAQGTVDVRVLSTIPKLQAELMRLQWMARRLK